MNVLMTLTIFAYFLAMVKFFLHLAARRKILFVLGTGLVILGFIFHTAMLYTISRETGHGPYTNPFEQANFFAWAVMGALASALLYFRTPPLGALVSPVGVLVMLYSFSLPSHGGSTMPREFWLTMHFTFSVLGLSSFAIVAVASVLYLVQERQLKRHAFTGWLKRIPDLGTLDKIFFYALVGGFPLLTVGIGSALFWTKSHYGSFLGEDPGRVVPLVLTWTLYTVLIVGRFFFNWQGHGLALLGGAAFLIAMAALGIHVSS